MFRYARLSSIISGGVPSSSSIGRAKISPAAVSTSDTASTEITEVCTAVRMFL